MAKVFWHELTWREMEEALPNVEAVLIPTGSTEQHGPHLAIIHDTQSAIAVCEEAARRLHPRALVALPLLLGYSPHNMSRRFPGTLTLRAETFMEVLLEVCDSLRRNGVKRAVIVNGHGGNQEAIGLVARRARDELGFDVAAASYWDLIPLERMKDVLEKASPLGPGHGGEFETSFALARFPQNVEPRYFSGPGSFQRPSRGSPEAHFPRYADEWLELGFTDDPRLASKEKGERLFLAAAEGLTRFVEEFVKLKSELRRHEEM